MVRLAAYWIDESALWQTRSGTRAAFEVCASVLHCINFLTESQSSFSDRRKAKKTGSSEGSEEMEAIQVTVLALGPSCQD
jgi:hypothetical protein